MFVSTLLMSAAGAAPRADTAPPPLTSGQSLSGGGGAFAAVIAMMNPAAHGRAVFYTAGGVCEGPDPAELSYYGEVPWTVHPFRSEVEGSVLLGAIVCNMGAVLVLYVMGLCASEGVSCLKAASGQTPARLGSAEPKQSRWGACAAMMHPSVWTWAFLVLYSGTALSAGRVLASYYRKEWSFVAGFFAAVGSIGVPIVVYRQVGRAARHARYRRPPQPHGGEHRLTRYFLGDGEWVVRKEVTEQRGVGSILHVLLTSYKPGLHWWHGVDFMWLFVLAGTGAPRLHTYKTCCGVKAGTAFVAITFAFAVYGMAPYCRPVDLLLLMCVNVAHAGGAVAVVSGVCTAGMDGDAFDDHMKWAGLCFRIGGVALLVKGCVDVLRFVYIVKSGRWWRTQAEEDGACVAGTAGKGSTQGQGQAEGEGHTDREVPPDDLWVPRRGKQPVQSPLSVPLLPPGEQRVDSPAASAVSKVPSEKEKNGILDAISVDERSSFTTRHAHETREVFACPPAFHQTHLLDVAGRASEVAARAAKNYNAAAPLLSTSVFGDETQFAPAQPLPGELLELSPLNPNVRPLGNAARPLIPRATGHAVVPRNTTQLTCLAIHAPAARDPLRPALLGP
eukprot:TRINITY_DN32772_c0_g1_i1.p1 TRINITY_DN32772_c0_g1~~TRINITY_DN32772_c0_g1_i1.p1  ORF type:complete len:616 (+),score=94.35 TRINITY_DN32772_c0_g1_i1:94-1941(+)